MVLARKNARDTLKLLLSVAFGYTMKAILDIPSQELCPPCKAETVAPVTVLVPCTKCSDCPVCVTPTIPTCPPPPELSDEIEAQRPLNEPFQPTTQFEVLRFDYFNSSHIYNNFDGDPGIWQLGHQSRDIQDIIKQGVTAYNKQTKGNWRYHKLLSGYKRLDPTRGEEYLIDVELATEAQNMALHKMETVYSSQRFDIVKPFSKARLLAHKPYLDEKTIYMVVPLTGFSSRLNRFLQNLIDIAWTRKGENVCLIIVLVVDKQKPEAAEEIKKIVASVQQQYPRADIQIIEMQGEGAFARGLTLDIGTRHLRNDSLIFFVDVDLMFPQSFLQRCRLNAVQGKRVFYPMMFSQYKPSLIKRYAPPHAQDLMAVNKYTGFWISYGFGQGCMYAQDYRTVGGFDLTIRGWGGEDVDLYNKFIKHNIQIVNCADSDLIHIYHDKFCSPSLPSDQLDMCIGTAAETLGHKQILGKHILFGDAEAKRLNRTSSDAAAAAAA